MGCRGYPKKKNSPICYGRFGFLFFFCFVKEISEENFYLKKKTKKNKKGLGVGGGKKYDRQGFRSRVEQQKTDPYPTKATTSNSATLGRETT